MEGKQCGDAGVGGEENGGERELEGAWGTYRRTTCGWREAEAVLQHGPATARAIHRGDGATGEGS